MCQGIQIQKLLQKPVIIIRVQDQINLVLQVKVVKIIPPHPGVSLGVVIVLPVRVQVAKATGLQDHQAAPRDLHIVLQGHQAVLQDLQFDHQDHQAVLQDLHPAQVAQDLPVQEGGNKKSC